MPGAPDPLYVAARRVLLDALEALSDHRSSIVLVGAQAIYIHTGDADLAIAPYTTDADLGIDPRRLASDPRLETALGDAQFASSPDKVGVWVKTAIVEGVQREVVVDLLVPASLGGPGRRGARIPPHGGRTARKVAGLEGALVDADEHSVASLNPQDDRSFRIRVAGPGALIVAKVHKIADRIDGARSHRRSDKDALDVLRLLRATPTRDVAARLQTLSNDPISRAVTEQALELLPTLFGRPQADGCLMVARAGAPLEPGETLAAATAVLTQELLVALRE